MASIQQSTKAYETWLRQELGGDVVEKDLDRKHDKMRENPFAFLRATYWRWAETVLEVCPELADAPRLLAVGDIHLENFGTWRDAEGRLVWGVNDFDEAADMPFTLDLVRLATSALMAGARRPAAAEDMCAAILKGYRAGLAAPRPIILDRDRQWLRELLAVPEKERAKYWKKIEAAQPEDAPLPYREILATAMPEPGLTFKTARRVAGAGSLGRPRWMAIADWRGGPALREAKALLVSSWQRAHAGPDTIRCGEIAAGHHRAPDPWYAVTGRIVVRRLSPNNRKIDADDEAFSELSLDMLEVMGLELANVHLGADDGAATAITTDLDRRKRGWLLAASKKMADATARDHADYRAKG